MSERSAKARLFVITGPSGVGKGSLLEIVRRHQPDELAFPISATTRDPRDGEVSGEHYHYLSEEEFLEGVNEGKFVEHARYSNQWYGTLVEELERPLSEGRPAILEIELLGARQIKERYPDSILIFISPPNVSELEARLRGRATDTEAAILRRLEQAKAELQAVSEYDHVVENDDLNAAASELDQLISSYCEW